MIFLILVLATLVIVIIVLIMLLIRAWTTFGEELFQNTLPTFSGFASICSTIVVSVERIRTSF